MSDFSRVLLAGIQKINEFNNHFLKKRMYLLFSLFVFINIVICLPTYNIFVDIFSHFKFQYFLLGIVFFIYFLLSTNTNKKNFIYTIISLLFVFVNFADLYPYLKKTNTNIETDFKLGVFNVLTCNDKYELFMKEVREQKPDIIIVQEVNDLWLNKISELKTTYPYFIEHPCDDNFGISIYSKFVLNNPHIEFWGEYAVPVAVVDVKIKNKKVKIVGVHTLPPTSKEYIRIRNEFLEDINFMMKDNDEKIIVAGDFNTTPFSYAYKSLLKNPNIKNAQTGFGYDGTWRSNFPVLFRIPLEQILIRPNMQVEFYHVARNFGSDHLPVFVGIKL